MSKLRMFREFLCERLRTGALVIFGAVKKHLAEYEEDIHRTNEECARLQRLLDIVTKPSNNKLHRTDVQLFSLQEPPQNKEELWTNQEEEQLQQMLTDTTNSIFTKESEMSSVKMSKLQEFEELHQEILTKAASEIFRTVEKTFADFEERICRTNEESARLQRLLDILTQPEIKLHRADVQLFSLQEPPQIKEELWTNQKEEQLQELQSDPADSIFTSLSVNHHSDQDFCEPPHLDITVKVESSEGYSLTTNSTEEQIKAEPDEKDCGAPEAASDSPPLSVVTPDCPTAQSSEEESGERLPVLQQTTEVTSPSDGLINLKKRHRGVQSYQCPECDQHFSFKCGLKTHMRRHRVEKSYQCLKCSKTFMYESTYKYHVVMAHSGEKRFPCIKRRKGFEKLYQCQECDRRYRYKCSLKLHMRKHTGGKPYQCQKCDRCYAHRSSLSHHMRKHTGGKPNQCSECSRCFQNKSAMLVHMRIHSGERPYQCQECNTTFRQMHHLSQHMMKHTGEKPFQCQECNKSFARQTSLIRHMWTHAPLKPLKI